MKTPPRHTQQHSIPHIFINNTVLYFQTSLKIIMHSDSIFPVITNPVIFKYNGPPSFFIISKDHDST